MLNFYRGYQGLKFDAQNTEYHSLLDLNLKIAGIFIHNIFRQLNNFLIK